ncbi:ABC transporter ATP-binding protein [Pseudochelatococcus sp. G4_1912]
MLSANNLQRYFNMSPGLIGRVTGKKAVSVHAVENVSFDIRQGETFSLVGESGCGKSTVARLIVGLYPLSNGKLTVHGKDLSTPRARKENAHEQTQLQMIFQDPYASLNPRMRVHNIIAEPIRFLRLESDERKIRQRVDELLRQVGLAPSDGNRFPHEFSGGQRQRLSIARALAGKPSFLICDEPTSALDVSVQAQILNLMKDLQQELGLTYLFISHNLAVVYHMSARVGVMYLGRIVEQAETKQLFNAPRHPYTRMLLDAVPDLAMTGRERIPIAGDVPSPLNPPSGCTFHPRCPFANARCKAEVPEPVTVNGAMVACHGVEEGRI